MSLESIRDKNGTENSSTETHFSTLSIVLTQWPALRLIINIISPLLLVSGTFGSVMTIHLCRRMKMQPGLSIYLTTLAVSDLAVLYFELALQVWLLAQFNFDLDDVFSTFAVLKVYARKVCVAISSWILAAVTTQRAISVAFPHQVNVICSNRKSTVVVCVITGIIILLFSHIFHMYFYVTSENLKNSSQSDVCRMEVYLYFYCFVWPWMEIIAVCVSPLTLLILSNCMMAIGVLTSVKAIKTSLTTGQCGHITVRKKKASSVTVMLIGLSVSYFVLTVPDQTIALLWIFQLGSDAATGWSLMLVLFLTFRFTRVFDSALRFYLYCLTGSKFRSEVFKIFSSGRKSSHSSTASGVSYARSAVVRSPAEPLA